MNSRFLTSVFIFVMILTLSFSSAHAAQEATSNILDKVESWGEATPYPKFKKDLADKGVTIQPYVKQRMEYTSNVFQAPSRKEDVIWITTPGIKTLYQKKDFMLGVNYETDFLIFTKHSKQNAQNQRLYVYTDLKPTSNTYLRASEQLLVAKATAGDSAFKPVNYRDNIVDVTGGYIRGKWTFQTAYQNFNRKFYSSITNLYNFQENTIDWRAYRQLTSRIRAYAGYKLGFVHYSKFSTKNGLWYEFPVGVEGDLGWGIKGTVNVGIQRRNYYSNTRRDFTGVVGSAAVKKTFRKKTSVELGILRRPTESSFGNQTFADEKLLFGGVNHLFTKKFRGRAGLQLGLSDYKESTFTGTRFLIGGATFISAADVRKRRDKLLSANIGLDYIVRPWLVFNVDYKFSWRDSNINSLDYTESNLSVGTTIPF